jgi:hypothetical protein
VVIGDKSALTVLGRGHVIINIVKFGDVHLVAGIGLNLLLFTTLHISTKKWNFG